METDRITASCIFLLLVLFVWCSPQVTAQQSDAAARLRLAQSLEQGGEWERAMSMYENLLENDPNNYVFFDGLRRAYTQLKKYDKAIDLVKHRLTVQPGDENLLAVLGGLYYQAGGAGKADSLWQLVIRKDPKNPNLYRLVAYQLMEHRQYEKAIKIYQEARAATGSQEYFIDELASLYGAILQYESATEEYVRMVRSKPQQLGYVQARMASLTSREQGRHAALKVVQQEVQRTPIDVSMHQLLAWLYIEGKDFESALGTYRTIDRLNKANGTELFQFAQRASQERAYLVAAKAFHEVVRQHPNQKMLPHGRFGYARAIEELSVGADTLLRKEVAAPAKVSQEGPVSESRPSLQGAIGLYESLIADYPNSEIAMQSLFRIGIIRNQRFFDLDGALGVFDRVRELQLNPGLANEATANIAEVLTAQNNLAQARIEYRLLLQLAPDQYRDRALFRLAELDYFEAIFDSALAKLKSITANVMTDLANDALQLQYFIQENKTTAQAALGAFAQADLLMRQRKYSEALVRFQHVAQQYSAALLAGDAYMRIGELHLLLSHASDAIAVFRQVVGMQTSILRDRAQMRVGEIYESIIKDKTHAIEAYEQVLTKFPTSLYVEEARRRIRLLRGDAI